MQRLHTPENPDRALYETVGSDERGNAISKPMNNKPMNLGRGLCAKRSAIWSSVRTILQLLLLPMTQNYTVHKV